MAKKLSKKMLKAMHEARIQRAISGFVIPMMSIPALYSVLDLAVRFGESDEKLKSIVARHPGVKESM